MRGEGEVGGQGKQDTTRRARQNDAGLFEFDNSIPIFYLDQIWNENRYKELQIRRLYHTISPSVPTGTPMNKHEIDLTDCKVLIVDDLPANLDVLSQALEDRGYNVLVATSGLIALKVAERTKPDLILLDVMMPEMDGLETCKRLKADPEKHDIPVIFLTAKTEMEDVIRGFEFGAVDYVTKPFNSTELLARVETHLKIHRLQKALEQRIDEIARMKREHEAFLRHELRNLITLILGYSQLVLGETLSDNQKRWTSKILDSSQHMSTLMDSLQKLQEFEAGEELKKKAISLELHPWRSCEDRI